MSRVLVIGGQGVLGEFVARTFSGAGWDVIRAGRRAEEAEDFLLLDLDDSAALANALGDADVVVNTAHHRDLAPERTALREGATLIDLTDLNAKERQSLHAESGNARGLVVADAGLSGVAYLALDDLLRHHPDADGAHYALMFSASGASGRAGALLGHALLTDTSHHESKKIRLPKPWGRQRCLEVGTGTARGTLSEALAEVPLRHYLSMQPRVLQTALLGLNAARLISFLPPSMFTAGTGKVPSEPSDEPICEWVSVSRNGKTLAARTIEGHGYYRMTAAAILIFAETLGRSSKAKQGLFDLYELVTLDEIARSLERHQISVNQLAVDD
jgi:NAD(P)-dependent dehydrogenase (short-subunit alcohol dehydrogenase family)